MGAMGSAAGPAGRASPGPPRPPWPGPPRAGWRRAPGSGGSSADSSAAFICAWPLRSDRSATRARSSRATWARSRARIRSRRSLSSPRRSISSASEAAADSSCRRATSSSARLRGAEQLLALRLKLRLGALLELGLHARPLRGQLHGVPRHLGERPGQLLSGGLAGELRQGLAALPVDRQGTLGQGVEVAGELGQQLLAAGLHGIRGQREVRGHGAQAHEEADDGARPRSRPSSTGVASSASRAARMRAISHAAQGEPGAQERSEHVVDEGGAPARPPGLPRLAR